MLGFNCMILCGGFLVRKMPSEYVLGLSSTAFLVSHFTVAPCSPVMGTATVPVDSDPILSQKYGSAPLCAGNMFQHLLRLRETADDTECYI
jgi:hypothetical protein